MQVMRIQNDNSNRVNNIAFKQILRNNISANTIKNKKFLLFISGPSGVGKDAAMAEISDKFNKVVTHTTRPKRQGEIDGLSYFYTTVEKFVEGIKNNEFVEYVKSFSGNYYGTKKETIKKALNDEKPALLIIDVDGAKNIKKNLQNDPNIKTVSIFFRPPSLDTLKQRLLKRGTETAKAIEERLGRAKYEMDNAKYFDAEIQVNNIPETLNDLKELLQLS